MANKFDPETGQPIKAAKQTVYEKESGKPLQCEPVDVAELIKSGFYVKDKADVNKKSKTAKSDDKKSKKK